MEIDKELLGFGAKAFADGVDDAAIGLVWDNAYDAGNINFAAAHGFPGGGEHGLDGILEGFLAFHAQKMCARGDGLGAGRATASAAGHVEEIGFAAIGTHHGREQAMGVRPILQNRRPGPIAKEHTGIAVLPIHNGRKFFRANHQHGVIGAGHNELLGDLQSIDEAGTSGLQIESRGAMGADGALDQTGGRGKGHDRCDDDKIDLFGRHSGLFHGALSSVGGEVGSELGFGGQPPLFDAGAGSNPFVRSVHHLFELGISKNFGGHIGADAGDRAGAALEIVPGARVLELGVMGRAHVRLKDQVL